MLYHLIDSSQRKKIDRLYPNFGKEARYLRLGLVTDGMNPYDNLSTQHSSWPVMLVIYNLPPWLLVIYNLPPWLCMKRKYMMLSLKVITLLNAHLDQT